MADKIDVYKAITRVAQELSKAGIGKDQQNKQQGFKFRGIDDVYNALAPILSKNNLCIIPRVLSREVTEKTTKNGGVLFYVAVEVEFDMVSAIDGSVHTAKTYGEAMDSGDKATNKAMSAAYKYLCFQAFCIPTEGDNDADATTHELMPEKKTTPKPKPVRISDERSNLIYSLIDESGSDMEKFLSYYKIKCIEDITTDKYDAIVTTLQNKIEKK